MSQPAFRCTTIAILTWLNIMSLNIGCLSERGFEMSPEESRRLAAAPPSLQGRNSTRDWLVTAHARFADLLPYESSPALLTGQMVDSTGNPVNVFAHFGVNPKSLRTLMGNLSGIQFTAQCASDDYYIDQPPPPWDGFDEVWAPIEKRVSLSGRLGFARRNGEVVESDCIVILPGFFGDNGVRRTRDLAAYLLRAGFHVLALEIRGHGQTEARYPNMYHTFGVMETDDLMQVADWLQSMPQVRRTGLVGYCWGANIALLAAWYENRPADDPSISPFIEPHLLSSHGPRRYEAGIMAFSPILSWEVLMDDLDEPRSYFSDPVYASIQQIVRDRMTRKGFSQPDGNLRRLIELEYIATNVPMPNGALEGYPFLRLLAYNGHNGHDKLERARVPVLMVHGVNDPLSPSQSVADFVATVDNPLVAAVILPNGGHVGFAAWAKRYYFSLISGFFDPQTGAAPLSLPNVAATGLH